VAAVKTIGNKWAGLKTKMTSSLVKSMPGSVVDKMVKKESDSIKKNGGDVPVRTAAMYGMMGAIKDEGNLKELVLSVMDGFFDPRNDKRKDAKKESPSEIVAS